MLVTFVTVFHVFVAIVLVITVLLQPGKGGDLGSMFGGGMSESIFGSSGAVPFLAKLTRVLAVLFILTSLTLGYFSSKHLKSSVVQDQPTAPIRDEFEVIPEDKEQESSDISSTKSVDEQESELLKDEESGTQQKKETEN